MWLYLSSFAYLIWIANMDSTYTTTEDSAVFLNNLELTNIRESDKGDGEYYVTYENYNDTEMVYKLLIYNKL